MHGARGHNEGSNHLGGPCFWRIVLKSKGSSAMRFGSSSVSGPFLCLMLLAVLALPGCTGLALGAGATVGVAAAKEGGISRAVSDTAIEAQISDLWFRSNVDIFRKLNVTVTEGRVLLTGIVQDPEHRVEAVRLAWQPKGVKQVINEIKVAKSEGIAGFAKDTWITTRLRTAITLDKDVQSVNYSIDTVGGTVYLMGFAQSRLELNKVVETARTIENVNQVVSYVKIISEGDVGGSAPVQEAPVSYPSDSSSAPSWSAPSSSPNSYSASGQPAPITSEDLP